MRHGFVRFVVRRAIAAALLVFAVSSAAMLLARVAPGDQLSGFDIDPAVAAAECVRIRCRDPLIRQYASWLGRAMRFDFGESARFRRPVWELVGERAVNTLVLGGCALVLATTLGIPAGVWTGSRPRHWFARLARGASILFLSLPPLVLALTLLLAAARTRWWPVGGLPPDEASLVEQFRYLMLPVLALAMPMAATLERLQSRAMADALSDRCVLAAMARGVAPRRIVWRHALKLSLKPVLAIYGIMIGALLSGSFAVEYIMAWPGLGALMYDALVFRDAYLVAGCAAAGTVALAVGIFLADVALAVADPRVSELA